MGKLAVVGGIVGMWVGSVAQTGEQRVWLVYGRECITSVSLTDKTELRFVMVDGRPDKKSAKLDGVLVDFKDSCGRYEVRRDAR